MFSLIALALVAGLAGPGPVVLTHPAALPAAADSLPEVIDSLPEVIQIQTGTGIVERELVGQGTRFEADGSRVYTRLVIDNPGPATALAMVWRRDGRVVQSLPVKAGESPRWRTWSYKTIGKRDVGQWSVEVLDEEGTPIARAAFEVVAPSAAVSLAR